MIVATIAAVILAAAIAVDVTEGFPVGCLNSREAVTAVDLR
jgi:hypothetical protein